MKVGIVTLFWLAESCSAELLCLAPLWDWGIGWVGPTVEIGLDYININFMAAE